VVGSNPEAGLGQALGIIANDVVAQSARAAETGGDRQIVPGRELDRLLAADDRHPDRRMRLLDWPRPHRDILVGPEFALVREYFLGPRPGDDVKGLFETGA
jgi:hypothetical protein